MANTKICPLCGKKIPALAEFCPECGGTLKEEAATAEERLNMVVDGEVEEEALGEDGGENKEEFNKRMEERRESYQKALEERRNRQRRMIPITVALILAAVAGGGFAINRIMNRDLPVVAESESAALESQVETGTAAESEQQFATGNAAADAATGTTAAAESTTAAAETTAAETSSAAETTAAETTAAEESTTAKETTTEAAIDTSNAKTMYTSTWLNVRSGPSGDSAVIGTTDNLEAIQVLDDSGNWYKIAFNGKVGYVYSGYVSSSKEKAKEAIAERESKEAAEESKKKESEEKEESKKKEEEKETKKSKGTDGSSVISDSSSKYLDEDDLEGMSAKELRRARNEIFARHGCIFNDESLQKYFEGKSWYKGTQSIDDFDWDDLNKYEQKNVELISDME